MILLVKTKQFFILLFSFVILSILVYTENTSIVDIGILLFIQNMSGFPILDVIMWIFTEIGGILVTVIFCMLLLIYKNARRIGLILLFTIIIGTILCEYMAYIINRDKPNLKFIGITLPLNIENDTAILGDSSSFPAGHIVRSTIISCIIANVMRKSKYQHLVWLFPITTSIGRLYMLQYYLTDIIGGVVIGIIVTTVIIKNLMDQNT